MKRIIFLLLIIFNYSATIVYSQSRVVLRADDVLVITRIGSQSHPREVYVRSGEHIIRKKIGDKLLASQEVVWSCENDCLMCKNTRTKSNIMFCGKQIEFGKTLYEQYCGFYRGKTRATRGTGVDRVKYMKELLSSTWYMCFDELRIESMLPQNIGEKKLYSAEPVNGGTLTYLDYDSETNEIVITKSKLEKMGVDVSDKEPIRLKVYYHGGSEKPQCLSIEMKIINLTYQQ